MTGLRIQQEAICYQWFKQRLILSVSEPSISQRSQIKEDTVEPSVSSNFFHHRIQCSDGDPLTGASYARGYEKSRFSTNIGLYLGTDARQNDPG